MDQETFYTSGQVCRAAGIARNTLVRWLKEGRIAEPMYRDRNGWRLFSQEELEAIKREARRVECYTPPQ